mmetsp:Transcript_30316/g.94112  ORF Transcript_30316/g.94112 Transcript_30316/m.94112 type:complete len:92 (+) Transcript_30316:354-629(+)
MRMRVHACCCLPDCPPVRLPAGLLAGGQAGGHARAQARPQESISQQLLELLRREVGARPWQGKSPLAGSTSSSPQYSSVGGEQRLWIVCCS